MLKRSLGDGKKKIPEDTFFCPPRLHDVWLLPPEKCREKQLINMIFSFFDLFIKASLEHKLLPGLF